MARRSSTGFITRREAISGGLAVASALTLPRAQSAASGARSRETRETLFDADWRFFRGDAPGAHERNFDNSSWRQINLPHDWSIEDVPGAPTSSIIWKPPAALWSEHARAAPKEGDFLVMPEASPATSGGAPHKVGPFDADSSPGKFLTGWTIGGTGWYRKAFSVSIDKDEYVELRFDGVFHDATVWLNGALLVQHDHGYSPFSVNLTSNLRPDGKNIISVCVRNLGSNSRWYSGSGIYRHVWLVRSGLVRIPFGGCFVTTPVVTTDKAQIHVVAEIENAAVSALPTTATIVFKDGAGTAVATATKSIVVLASARARIAFDTVIQNPTLWAPNQPGMYQVELALMVHNVESDRVTVSFGIRTVAADAHNGLTINGKSIKLKGACLHHDNGLLGAAAIDSAEIRKVELMKENGFNALRCAHNLYSPAFMDACDRLGMLVIDETLDTWNSGKMGVDARADAFKAHYRDYISDMVLRDRNHPSVIFWSIGNEIPERNTPEGVATAAELRKVILELDNSRLITAALAPLVSGNAAEPSTRSLDVVGYNYMQYVYEADHAENPNMVLMGTEQYAADMYDAWSKIKRYPWVIGDFIWSGMDYLGEVGTGSSQLRRDGEARPKSILPFSIWLWDYPAYQSGCGELDILGCKKPRSYYRDVLWQRSEIELFVQRPAPAGFHEELTEWAWGDELKSWTWPAAKQLTVRVYSIGDEVRLSLNGRAVGRKSIGIDDKLTAEFAVSYEPGELEAVAYREGVELKRAVLKTAGAPRSVRIRAERKRIGISSNDLAYVFAEICDSHGELVPDAQEMLTFAIQGPARLVAAGSANPRGVSSFTKNSCLTFHGTALAICAPTGNRGVVTISVSSPGLMSSDEVLEFG